MEEAYLQKKHDLLCSLHAELNVYSCSGFLVICDCFMMVFFLNNFLYEKPQFIHLFIRQIFFRVWVLCIAWGSVHSFWACSETVSSCSQFPPDIGNIQVSVYSYVMFFFLRNDFVCSSIAWLFKKKNRSKDILMDSQDRL